MTDSSNHRGNGISTDEVVKEYYTSQVRQEWRRLVMDAYHRIEFFTTLHYLDKYLPPHGLVLDAGGGPGRYTVELAKKGYDLVLLDATQANLDFAKRQVKRQRLQAQVKQFVTGSIVDLSPFPDASFDAVVCTGGPLSHVLDPHHRSKAISELIRVVKPGGPLFVSVISRFGVFLEFLNFPPELEMPHFEQLRDTGDYLGGHGFTAAHFFLLDEFKQAFIRPEVKILEMVGLEGISTQHSKMINRLAKHEKLFSIWMQTHFQTCTHPSAVGISEHMLIICRKNVA